jgi:hypothetical protein
MSWVLLALVLIITLIVAVVRGKLKKAKPVIEVQADETQLRSLDLKPGEFVEMVPDENRKEVTVYSARQSMREKLGVINNGFVYRNVIKRNIMAKIDSVTGGKIMLEIVRNRTCALMGKNAIKRKKRNLLKILLYGGIFL